MRRKKDDKIVLRRGNGRNEKRRRTPNLSFNRNNNRRSTPNRRNNRVKKEKKRSKKTVLLMIMVLLAFIVGSGIGVLLSFDDGSGDNETHVENVTVEMTSNLNQSNNISFDEADHVDYNENQTSEILDAENNPYYRYDDLTY